VYQTKYLIDYQPKLNLISTTVQIILANTPVITQGSMYWQNQCRNGIIPLIISASFPHTR